MFLWRSRGNKHSVKMLRHVCSWNDAERTYVPQHFNIFYIAESSATTIYFIFNLIFTQLLEIINFLSISEQIISLTLKKFSHAWAALWKCSYKQHYKNLAMSSIMKMLKVQWEFTTIVCSKSYRYNCLNSTFHTTVYYQILRKWSNFQWHAFNSAVTIKY